MCWCTPNMRTPCCGSDACHRMLDSMGAGECPWHKEPTPEPKEDARVKCGTADGTKRYG